MKNLFPLRFILVLGAVTISTMFSTFSISASIVENCSIEDRDFLRAEYKIVASNSEGNTTETSLILWRKGNEVAHQYPQTGITEAWQLIGEKRLKPIRFFDLHQRAIEYQPGESVHGKRESDWSYRYQLVTDTVLSKMNNLENASNRNALCHTVLKTANFGHTALSLDWLQEQKLIRNMSVEEHHQSVKWTLVSVTSDRKEIAAFFDKRNDYYATDFADIGDDHTDPFLTQMVTQGFIEHGASGFYNDKGEAIGQHHH